MRHICILITLSLLSLSAIAQDNTNFHSFKMTNIDGDTVQLDQYKGHVVLVVNVASRCGLTPQYKQLQSMYDTYKDKGLKIVAFPCNDFGKQEPGTAEQIKTFCSTKYNVTFDLMAKIHVKGKNQHPLYAYLTGAKGNGPIKWNFEKFLIGKDGNVIERFPPKTKPNAPKVITLIDTHLEK